MTLKKDVLGDLINTSDALSDRIIALSPPSTDHTSPEWIALQSLMRERDKINGVINQLIESAFNQVADGLDAQAAQLKQETDGLTKIKQTLDTVDDVVKVADAIVQVASKIVSMAAG